MITAASSRATDGATGHREGQDGLRGQSRGVGARGVDVVELQAGRGVVRAL